MATFDKAVRYEVTAVTETPLRTGPSDGSIDRVLRHRDGQAFLQAASLAGALRGWLEKQEKNAANALFGSQEKSGQLIVSDMEIKEKAAESAEDTMIQLRPRLRINGKMGSAADGGKFDVAHIARNTVMQFTLTWLGAESDTDGPAQIEQMLGALHAGEIRLGAQKSNGFGRVALTVRSQIYHMTDKADREAWLQDEFDGQTLELPKICTKSVCTFTVNGVADSILIKGSVPRVEYDENNTRKEIIQNIKENGTAVLPGSSVKGAVRARVQAIADLLDCSEAVDELFGRGAAQGDNGIAGRVRFTDVVLDKAKEQKISRIRINKFTGGVIRRGLFTEEPLKSGVTLTITAPQDDICGCALLVYALRDLGLGLYNLGSGGAVGRGYIKVSRIAIACGGQNRRYDIRRGRLQAERHGQSGFGLAAYTGGTHMKLLEPISVEQALEQAQTLKFVMITELSRVVIGKVPMDINWDELIEARFFDHDTEIRIFRENSELRARSVILQDDMPYIEKQYKKLQGNLGSEISVREYLTFDEDGQAGVSAVCLYDWRE